MRAKTRLCAKNIYLLFELQSKSIQISTFFDFSQIIKEIIFFLINYKNSF